MIFACGTGIRTSLPIPGGAAGCRIDAELILKATKVDGVYDSDPLANAGAKKYDKLSYIDVLNKSLKVLDSTATSLCMDNKIPIVVFDMTTPGNIMKVLQGENIGTLVGDF